MKLFLMFSWVLGQLPPRKSAPIPKTNPKPNLNLNRGWGDDFPRGQFPKPNPYPNRAQI